MFHNPLFLVKLLVDSEIVIPLVSLHNQSFPFKFVFFYKYICCVFFTVGIDE